MNLRSKVIFLSLLSVSYACESHAEKGNTRSDVNRHEVVLEQDLSGYQKAYFASGCFWCVEAIFESVSGVQEVVSGYAGGSEKNPTYEQVSYGRTGHAEAVVVYYNPKEVSFKTLVEVFFGSHDPTTLNRQGPDRGKQYRSIAFYQTPEEQKIITSHIAELTRSKAFENPIVTEVTAFTTFWKAEAYHQNYERNHPENPYIQQISIPRLNRFKAKFPELLKSEH